MSETFGLSPGAGPGGKQPASADTGRSYLTPGWYPGGNDSFILRWFNGTSWTGKAKPAYASPIWRIAATSLDVLVLGFAWFALGLILTSLFWQETGHIYQLYMSIGFLLVLTVYSLLCARLLGASPGMRVMGCRIIDNSGRKPGWWQAFSRGVLVSLLPAYWLNSPDWVVVSVAGFWGVSCSWILFNRRRRGLHDLAAGTYVIRAPWNLATQTATWKGL